MFNKRSKKDTLSLIKFVSSFFLAVCFCFVGVACSETDPPEQPDGTPVYCTVTFVQENLDDVVKTVEKGKALTDVPTPEARTGYTASWSVTDFSAITQDMTVTVTYTAKTYTIHLQSEFDYDGVREVNVEFGKVPELPVPQYSGKAFNGWLTEDGQAYVLGAHNVDNDLTLTAVWVEEDWFGPFLP